MAFTILKARISFELATASLRLEWRYRFAHRIPKTSLISSAPFAPSVFSAFSRARTIASSPSARKLLEA
jgi:hypothetical protein